MNFITQTPVKGLPRTYLKKDIPEGAFLRFFTPLKDFIKNLTIAEKMKESEEHVKNHAIAFLQDAFFKGSNLVNTYGRVDLAIYCGKDANSKIAVIVECKRDSNKADMITKGDFNFKALHEAILYFLREQDDKHNDEIRRIVITDGWQWFIFDSADFLRLFSKDYTLITEYRKWKTGKKTDSGTDAFYGTVGNRLRELDNELRAIYFDLHDLKGISDDTQDKAKVVFKCLAPQYLLKEEMANDSNVLNTIFYNELLHIIGLEEKKVKGKALIRRVAIPEPASLIEKTIRTIDEGLTDKLNLADYGATKNEQLFNVALELCMTWINRVIFLKLLEAQLIHYHNGNPNGYAFLSAEKIQDFDVLHTLFFQVLAKKPENRTDDLPEHWRNVPYLNSSLFEMSDLEKATMRISNLANTGLLPIHQRTVLIDEKKRRLTGKLPTLEYLLRFLGAWSFGKESEGGIVKEEKTIINASVLGLIFEKINGYKDGSFYTPGFITEYMANTTVEQAVVTKFNAVYHWKCISLTDVKNEIYKQPASFIADANKTVDSLRVCDPAVGSGHFLVSVLNAIIALKSDLGILVDMNGARLRDYTIRVEYDELDVSDESEGTTFRYHLRESDNKPIPESQRVQETLFNEKRKIIENCLFGVDINPNSVNICRLRLWIELLKHAYYTKESGYTCLETLPNIDINIKCGDSLISRFSLDISLKEAEKQTGHPFKDYADCVRRYRRTDDKTEKQRLSEVIAGVKLDFKGRAARNSKDGRNLAKAQARFIELRDQRTFEGIAESPEERENLMSVVREEVAKYEVKIRQIESGEIYRHAFEWRFEFPEILDADGNFSGFDVVIGNPPFGFHNIHSNESKIYFKQHYTASHGSFEHSVLFYEAALRFLGTSGILAFIAPVTWLTIPSAKSLRRLIMDRYFISEICWLSEQAFESASVNTLITRIVNSEAATTNIKIYKLLTEFPNEPVKCRNIPQKQFVDAGYYISIFSGDEDNEILAKLRRVSKPLSEFARPCSGYNPYEIGSGEAPEGGPHTKETVRSKPYHSNSMKGELWRPEIVGRNLSRYHVNISGDRWVKYGPWLSAPRDPNNFRGKRILVQEITGGKEMRLVSAYYEEELYHSRDIIPIKLENSILNPLYLLAVINSWLMTWYHQKCNPKAQKGLFPKILVSDLKKLPVFPANADQQNAIAELVSMVMAAKQHNIDADTSATERAIDELVYTLYGLSKDEIAFVEESAIKPEMGSTMSAVENVARVDDIV